MSNVAMVPGSSKAPSKKSTARTGNASPTWRPTAPQLPVRLVQPHQHGTATVYAIQDSPQGLYVGGAFSGFDGKYHARLARLNFNGPPNPAFRTWTDGTVRSIRFQWSDGKLLVAGNFGTVYGYTPRTGLARFNADGSLDRAF